MYAFYMSLEKPAGSHTENTFRIWRSRNHNENKLANVRRDIMNKKRLTNFELRELKEKVIADVKDIDSGNAGIRDGSIDDRDEGTGSVSCTDAGTRGARTRYVDQRKNVNHIGGLGDIPIDQGSEDKFVILQVITLSFLIRVSMKIVQLLVTLKNERVIELIKKTMMLSLLLLETKLFKLLKN